MRQYEAIYNEKKQYSSIGGKLFQKQKEGLRNGLEEEPCFIKG
jgi:hypothetical protein